MAELSSTKIYGNLDVTGKFKKNTQVVSAATTLVANGPIYLVNTSSAAFNLTLPITAVAGDAITIHDATSSFDTNLPVVVRNGHNIMGLAEDLTLDILNTKVEFVYVDSTLGWRVFA